MATMTGAHAANENDKIAPPHGNDITDEELKDILKAAQNDKC